MRSVRIPFLAALATTLGFGAAFLPAASFAQRDGDLPTTRFEGRVEVRLVQIDAWAVDSGRPVLDLTQSELKLTEDGKPVDILYFAAPVADLAPPPQGTPPEGAQPEPPDTTSAPTEPAVVAIFLDEPHLGLGSRAKTIAALREWVAGGGVPEGASTMLVAHGRELKVLLGRTTDERRLVEALDSLGGPSTLAVDLRMEERRALEQIREHQRASLEQTREMPSAGGGGAAADGAAQAAQDAGEDPIIYFEAPCSGRLLQYAEDYADRVKRDAEASLESLRAFAESMAMLRGRKILVFVSEGMPARPGGVAFDYVRTLCDGSGVREGIQYAMDVQAQAGTTALRGQLSAGQLALAGEDRHMRKTVDQVVAHANSSGVSVWTFGARGLTVSGADASNEVRIATPATTSRQQGEADDLLNVIAADTGGRAIRETNDFGAALGQLADDLFHAYSIAFASARTGDGKLHQIRLETTRPGVQLRYRRSWRDGSTEEELAALVGGALSFGIDRRGLRAVATIGRQRGEAGPQRLILRLTLPRDAVAAVPGGKGAPQGLLRLAIALKPVDGEATPIRTRTISVDVAADGAKPGEPIVQDIALPEIGKGSLVAVGLRDEVSGETGVFRLEVGGP